jgi:hypothetical protein
MNKGAEFLKNVSHDEVVDKNFDEIVESFSLLLSQGVVYMVRHVKQEKLYSMLLTLASLCMADVNETIQRRLDTSMDDDIDCLIGNPAFLPIFTSVLGLGIGIGMEQRDE